MRLLSPRLVSRRLRIGLPHVCPGIRLSSRYSSPIARSRTALNATSGIPAHTSLHTTGQREDQSHEDSSASQTRQMRITTIKLLMTLATLSLVLSSIEFPTTDEHNTKSVTQLDAPADSNATFRGKEVHVIGTGQDKLIVVHDHDSTELVETGTSSVPYFPRTISLSSTDSRPSSLTSTVPATEEEYTLLGLGIRTVSFLSIQVYVLGLYVRTQDITSLQARLIHHIDSHASTLIPSEKEQLKNALLDPVQSTLIWDTLLRDASFKSAWRIVPTRNTDFAHLRDGWITGIKRGTLASTLAHPSSQGVVTPSEYDGHDFGDAVKAFKDVFLAKGKAPKGSVVTLLRHESGAMDVLSQNVDKEEIVEKLGSVEDARISRLIWMGYLAGKDVSSEAARRNVVDGWVRLAARPVGSIK